MNLNISIKKDASVATVTTEEEGKYVNKTVPLESLIKLFTTLNGTKRDTGYLASNLLREDVGNVSNRAYYFKNFIADCRVSVSSSLRNVLKTDNPYGISIDENAIVIKDMNYRDIVGVISNSNTDVFNVSYYKIYNAVVPLSGVINDSTRLVQIFPNQFGNRVCWPDGLDQSFLSKKDFSTQSTFVTRYLCSKFNNDLYRNSLTTSHLSSQDKQEYINFLLEIFNIEREDIVGTVNGYSVALQCFLIYFFLSNIKKINPATVARSESESTLGAFFSNSDR